MEIKREDIEKYYITENHNKSECLDYFGLSSIEDLPNIEELIQTPEEDEENTDLYTSKYTEKDLEELD